MGQNADAKRWNFDSDSSNNLEFSGSKHNYRLGFPAGI